MTQEQVDTISRPSGRASLTALLGQTARSEFGTEVECDRCAQRFVAYGLFKGCTGCGLRLSAAFLKKNVSILRKEIDLAQTVDPIVAAPAIARVRKNAIALERAFRHGFWPWLDPVPPPRSPEEEEKRLRAVERVERAKQQAGALSVFDFPTEKSALAWTLVNAEKTLRDYLSIVEESAEDWIEQHQHRRAPAP